MSGIARTIGAFAGAGLSASIPTWKFLVPRVMEERYASDLHRVDARADYSNFQRFSVEVGVAPDLDAIEP